MDRARVVTAGLKLLIALAAFIQALGILPAPEGTEALLLSLYAFFAGGADVKRGVQNGHHEDH